MKNIQEILLKCGGVGKLILGDEEIEISVSEVKSRVHNLGGYGHTEDIVFTNLDVCLLGDDFCRAKEPQEE